MEQGWAAGRKAGGQAGGSKCTQVFPPAGAPPRTSFCTPNARGRGVRRRLLVAWNWPPAVYAPAHRHHTTGHPDTSQHPQHTARGGRWFQSRGRVPTGPGLDQHALTLHARMYTRVHTRNHREAWSDTHTGSRPVSAALSAWGMSVPPPTAAHQRDTGVGLGGGTVPAAGAWPRGVQAPGGTRRSSPQCRCCPGKPPG